MDSNDLLIIIYTVIPYLFMALIWLKGGRPNLKNSWIAKKKMPHVANVLFIPVFLYIAVITTHQLSSGCTTFGSESQNYCGTWQYYCGVAINIALGSLFLFAALSPVKKTKD